MDIKVITLPREIDANLMIKDEIKKENSICPFCGETKNYLSIIDNYMLQNEIGVEDCMIHISWYGKHDEDTNHFAWLRFFEKNHQWRRDQYQCHTCGAEWYSRAYPTDIGGFH